MITERKCILATRKTRKSQSFLNKFEALEFAENIFQIYEIWENNKTPIVTEKLANIEDYDIVKIPNRLIGKSEEFIEFCHECGFESGEYITGKVYDTKLERCFLCEIANYRGFRSLDLYNQYVDNEVDCIIYESPNFYVVPELGALKQGYLMIVPKEHILSVAQFPNEIMEEYYEVCKDIEKILLSTFNGSVVTFMEHGSGPSGKSSHKKSIVHAHTHVVVDFTLDEKYKKMVKLIKCDDISKAKDVHYFSYQEGTSRDLTISMDPNVYVQRQYPRQVMAKELGYAPEQYNWRQNEFKEITHTTLYMLCKELTEMAKSKSNQRIRTRTKAFVLGFSKR